MLSPLKWEQSLNSLIEEEELFELLENQEEFMGYLKANNLKFESVDMVTLDYQNDKCSRMFTFESIARLFINDGDPVKRAKQKSLLDDDLRSMVMVIDQDHQIMYVILLGKKSY